MPVKQRRTYTVIVSRGGSDIGQTDVVAMSENDAIAMALWDLTEAASISPHDVDTHYRAVLTGNVGD